MSWPIFFNKHLLSIPSILQDCVKEGPGNGGKDISLGVSEQGFKIKVPLEGQGK